MDQAIDANELFEAEVQHAFRQVRVIERICVFMGPGGVGKSTLFGCIQGSITQHALSLKSQTSGVNEVKFVKSYTDDKGRYDCLYKCYDLEGFSGNPEKDIWILNDLVGALREGLPKIHVIYYCLTAVRMSDPEAATLKLVVDHGGPELRSRIRFIMTNAPARVIRENPRILTETAGRLSEIVGHTINVDDIITSDLPDPNQYEESDVLYAATMANWMRYQVLFQEIVRDIPEEQAFRINKISYLHRAWSLCMVYRTKILLLLATIVILSLLFQAVESYEKMRIVIQDNISCKDALANANSAAADKNSSNFAMRAVKGSLSFVSNMFAKLATDKSNPTADVAT